MVLQRAAMSGSPAPVFRRREQQRPPSQRGTCGVFRPPRTGSGLLESTHCHRWRRVQRSPLCDATAHSRGPGTAQAPAEEHQDSGTQESCVNAGAALETRRTGPRSSRLSGCGPNSFVQPPPPKSQEPEHPSLVYSASQSTSLSSVQPRLRGTFVDQFTSRGPSRLEDSPVYSLAKHASPLKTEIVGQMVRCHVSAELRTDDVPSQTSSHNGDRDNVRPPLHRHHAAYSHGSKMSGDNSGRSTRLDTTQHGAVGVARGKTEVIGVSVLEVLSPRTVSLTKASSYSQSKPTSTKWARRAPDRLDDEDWGRLGATRRQGRLREKLSGSGEFGKQVVHGEAAEQLAGQVTVEQVASSAVAAQGSVFNVQDHVRILAGMEKGPALGSGGIQAVHERQVCYRDGCQEEEGMHVRPQQTLLTTNKKWDTDFGNKERRGAAELKGDSSVQGGGYSRGQTDKQQSALHGPGVTETRRGATRRTSVSGVRLLQSQPHLNRPASRHKEQPSCGRGALLDREVARVGIQREWKSSPFDSGRSESVSRSSSSSRTPGSGVVSIAAAANMSSQMASQSRLLPDTISVVEGKTGNRWKEGGNGCTETRGVVFSGVKVSQSRRQQPSWTPAEHSGAEVRALQPSGNRRYRFSASTATLARTADFSRGLLDLPSDSVRVARSPSCLAEAGHGSKQETSLKATRHPPLQVFRRLFAAVEEQPLAGRGGSAPVPICKGAPLLRGPCRTSSRPVAADSASGDGLGPTGTTVVGIVACGKTENVGGDSDLKADGAQCRWGDRVVPGREEQVNHSGTGEASGSTEISRSSSSEPRTIHLRASNSPLMCETAAAVEPELNSPHSPDPLLRRSLEATQPSGGTVHTLHVKPGREQPFLGMPATPGRNSDTSAFKETAVTDSCWEGSLESRVEAQETGETLQSTTGEGKGVLEAAQLQVDACSLPATYPSLSPTHGSGPVVPCADDPAVPLPSHTLPCECHFKKKQKHQRARPGQLLCSPPSEQRPAVLYSTAGEPSFRWGLSQAACVTPAISSGHQPAVTAEPCPLARVPSQHLDVPGREEHSKRVVKTDTSGEQKAGDTGPFHAFSAEHANGRGEGANSVGVNSGPPRTADGVVANQGTADTLEEAARNSKHTRQARNAHEESAGARRWQTDSVAANATGAHMLDAPPVVSLRGAGREEHCTAEGDLKGKPPEMKQTHVRASSGTGSQCDPARRYVCASCCGGRETVNSSSFFSPFHYTPQAAVAAPRSKIEQDEPPIWPAMAFLFPAPLRQRLKSLASGHSRFKRALLDMKARNRKGQRSQNSGGSGFVASGARRTSPTALQSFRTPTSAVPSVRCDSEDAAAPGRQRQLLGWPNRCGRAVSAMKEHGRSRRQSPSDSYLNKSISLDSNLEEAGVTEDEQGGRSRLEIRRNRAGGQHSLSNEEPLADETSSVDPEKCGSTAEAPSDLVSSVARESVLEPTLVVPQAENIGKAGAFSAAQGTERQNGSSCRGVSATSEKRSRSPSRCGKSLGDSTVHGEGDCDLHDSCALPFVETSLRQDSGASGVGLVAGKNIAVAERSGSQVPDRTSIVMASEYPQRPLSWINSHIPRSTTDAVTSNGAEKIHERPAGVSENRWGREPSAGESFNGDSLDTAAGTGSFRSIPASAPIEYKHSARGSGVPSCARGSFIHSSVTVPSDTKVYENFPKKLVQSSLAGQCPSRSNATSGSLLGNPTSAGLLPLPAGSRVAGDRAVGESSWSPLLQESNVSSSGECYLLGSLSRCIDTSMRTSLLLPASPSGAHASSQSGAELQDRAAARQEIATSKAVIASERWNGFVGDCFRLTMPC